MFRVTETPQGGRVVLAGKEVVNLAANNYLGLANAPELVAAAKASLDEFGVGPCASRNIVGEFPAHACLKKRSRVSRAWRQRSCSLLAMPPTSAPSPCS